MNDQRPPDARAGTAIAVSGEVTVSCLAHEPARVFGTTKVGGEERFPDGSSVWSEEGARRWCRMMADNHARNCHGPMATRCVIRWPSGLTEIYDPPTITVEQQARGLMSSGIHPAKVIAGWTGVLPESFLRWQEFARQEQE